ncbi:hypothetical protein I4U23_001137 [Adineta vaga]|nr:hypothetical protein I4U23_001137 [Adineta vaga]
MEINESSSDARIVGLEAQILNSQEVIVRLNRELDSALLRITTLENVCSDNQNDLHEKRSRIQQLNDELIEQEELTDHLRNEIQTKESQITFDRELRELIQYELNDTNENIVSESPQFILDQYHHHQRSKFYELLQQSLITEDISNLIDSDDILFELLIHLNSLNRLKETLSRDSKQLQHIRTLLHLTNDNDDELIKDFITKKECIEYIRTKVDNHHEMTDLELIKYVLHDYFNYQEQKIDLNDTIHMNTDLMKHLNELIQEFSQQTITSNTNEVSTLDHLRLILQSNFDFQQTLLSEISVTSIEDILPRIHEYKSMSEKHSNQEDLIKEIDELKQQVNQTKEQLSVLTNLLELDSTNEIVQINMIHSYLQSCIDFRENLSKKLSSTNDLESILQRIDDYQRIITYLNSNDNHWTNETTDKLIMKLQMMETSIKTNEDLQIRLDEAIDNEKQLQADIEEIADEFSPQISDNRKSNLTRIHETLQSLINFRQELFDTTQMKTDKDILQLFSKYSEKQDNHEMDLQTQINELKLNEEKLRHLLNVEDEDLVESVMKLNTNFLQLKEEHESLVTKEEMIDQSIKRLINKFGLSSEDSSISTQIDEIDEIFDRFRLEYCQLTSMSLEIMNLIEIFKHIRIVTEENSQIKELIHQIDSEQSLENFNTISKLQIYLIKVDSLCQLIDNDKISIDQAIALYQERTQHDKHIIEKISDFKQQLLNRLAIDNEEHIFDRLNELYQMNTDLQNKLQTINDSSSTIASLNKTISEHEETSEKLRAQRERMLNKMKEMKTNNESLTDQLKQANLSLTEQHRIEIDYKNQIEQLEQQIRHVNNQLQVTSDECQTQQDLQETMKLEITSIQQENETQRKLYESRCRQIIHEKNQLDKSKKELIEQKHSLEDENKRLQTILHTIQNTLENVDDINGITDAILQLRQDQMIITSKLHEKHEQLNKENEKLLLNIQQKQIVLNECNQTKNQLEKRLIDDEQQLRNFKQEINEKNEQYQQLQNEFQSYKEEISFEKKSSVAIIDIEQSPPPQSLPIQQTASLNNWMSIDMQEDDIPLTITNKHSSISSTTTLLNMFGEMKSKLGITLTHRPRSSSVFFFYLCAVHLLTIYLLFFRHC